MNVEDFYMAVGEVIPEFDGEFAGDMNFHTPTRRIVFYKIREVGGEGGNLPEAFE